MDHIKARLEQQFQLLEAEKRKMEQLLARVWPIQTELFVMINPRHQRPVAAVVVNYRQASVLVRLCTVRAPVRAVHFRDVVSCEDQA